MRWGHTWLVALVAAGCAMWGVASCGDDSSSGTPADTGPSDTGGDVDAGTDADAQPDAEVPETVPDFDAATFSAPLTVDNPYFPLVPNTVRTYFAESEDGAEIVVEETLTESRTVMGIDTRVVLVREYLDGEQIEETRDWYAQDDDGNVWYLGEAVDNYNLDDEGQVIDVTHEGAWEAGLDVADVGVVARPGYIMLASPTVGDAYHQEYYVGEAEDQARVVALDAVVTLADGSEYSTLHTLDSTRLEADSEEDKHYAEGIGLVMEAPQEDVREKSELTGIFLTGDDTIPDFNASDFSDPTTIDNPYLPWVPGTAWVYEAETEDGVERTEVTVTSETRTVAGVESVIVHDQVFLDGDLIEDTHDWYAQDDAGNVWYLGEAVDDYNYDDQGELIDITHEGAWETGTDPEDVGESAVAGIVMPATPTARTSYRQEYYAGEAEDMAFVAATEVSVEVDSTLYEDCVQVLEWNPLEPGVLEYKYACSGVGVVLEVPLGEEPVELTEYTPGS